MKTELEDQITAKRIPTLVGMVAKLEAQAFQAELEARAARTKADAARAELRRLTGEAEPAAAPAPLTPPPPPRPPLDVPDELTTCPDPDIHLPRPPVLSDLARAAAAHPLGAAGAPAAQDLPGRPSGPLVEAGRRGYAAGQEETLAWVADQLELEVGTDEVDEVRAAIEVRLHDLRQPRPAAGIADHVVPPAPAAPPPRAPEPLETIAERCGGCGAQATGTDAAGSTWCDACWAKPARDRGTAAPIGRRAPAAPATKPGCLCEEIDPSDRPCLVCEIRRRGRGG